MSCDCIDYPVSWDFWRAHCIECHGYDPGDNEYHPPEPSPEPVILYQNVPLKRLDNIQRDLIETRDTLQKHLNTKKKDKYIVAD